MEETQANSPDEPQRTLERGLEASSFESPAEARHGSSPGGLEVCPACDSRLVHPVAWTIAGRNRWSVDLRCPDCEWSGGGTFEQSVVERLDEALDRGTEELLDDLKALARANLEGEIDRFAAALHAGHILPEDF